MYAKYIAYTVLHTCLQLYFTIINKSPRGLAAHLSIAINTLGAVCCKGSFSHLFLYWGGALWGPWGPSHVLTWWNKHSLYMMLQTTHLDPTFLGSEKGFLKLPPLFSLGGPSPWATWGHMPYNHMYNFGCLPPKDHPKHFGRNQATASKDQNA